MTCLHRRYGLTMVPPIACVTAIGVSGFTIQSSSVSSTPCSVQSEEDEMKGTPVRGIAIGSLSLELRGMYV